jgi:RNA polymerase sigma-70 factor, ECF subfamily
MTATLLKDSPLSYSSYLDAAPQRPGATAIDQQVIVAATQGDHEAFEKIHGRYNEKLYNCLYRLVGNSDDASILASETWLRAWKGIGRFDGEYKIGTWLYKIATNLAMDELRRKKLLIIESVEQRAELGLFHPKEVARDDPERDVIRHEDREMVHQVLQQLPPKYRFALVLREYQGMSCEEIGQVIGSTRSAVKSLLFRAREEFRKVHRRLDSFSPSPLSKSNTGSLEISPIGFEYKNSSNAAFERRQNSDQAASVSVVSMKQDVKTPSEQLGGFDQAFRVLQRARQNEQIWSGLKPFEKTVLQMAFRPNNDPQRTYQILAKIYGLHSKDVISLSNSLIVSLRNKLDMAN